MKRLVTSCLLIAALLNATPTLGTDFKEILEISVVEGKEIRLALKDMPGQYDIYIKDSYGVVLYNNTFKATELTKRFDISAFPNGNYFIELDKPTKIKVIPFNVRFDKIEFDKESESVIYKPIIRIKDDLIFVSKFALEKESLEVSLFDADRNLIYRSELKDRVDLNLILKMSQLNSGQYLLSCKSDGRTYHKILII